MTNNNKINNLQPGNIAIVGIPFDEYSSFFKGCAKGPENIRKILYSGVTNMCTENLIDLESEDCFTDIGNIKIENYLSSIEENIEGLLNKDVKIISLGGDHSITYPIIRAFNKKYGKINILHFDAHPDLYNIFEGNPYSHACPFARIMEEQLASKLISVGIRTLNPHQKLQAENFGVEIIDMNNLNKIETINIGSPLYLSIDLDVLDPSYAPGVSHHEPGGITTQELLKIIQSLNSQIIGADIVELNPERDNNGITASVAVKILKEVLGKMNSN